MLWYVDRCPKSPDTVCGPISTWSLSYPEPIRPNSDWWCLEWSNPPMGGISRSISNSLVCRRLRTRHMNYLLMQVRVVFVAFRIIPSKLDLVRLECDEPKSRGISRFVRNTMECQQRSKHGHYLWVQRRMGLPPETIRQDFFYWVLSGLSPQSGGMTCFVRKAQVCQLLSPITAH